MEQTLLIVVTVVALWFAVAAVVALGFGRAVRIADGRRRGHLAYAASMRRVPARAR